MAICHLSDRLHQHILLPNHRVIANQWPMSLVWQSVLLTDSLSTKLRVLVPGTPENDATKQAILQHCREQDAWADSRKRGWPAMWSGKAAAVCRDIAKVRDPFSSCFFLIFHKLNLIFSKNSAYLDVFKLKNKKTCYFVRCRSSVG